MDVYCTVLIDFWIVQFTSSKNINDKHSLIDVTTLIFNFKSITANTPNGI